VKFLKQIIDNDEQLLNPTAFIQSTHNTVSGQIALLLGCKAHNLTFTQKTLSFESALLEALLLVREDPNMEVLLGGVDEITEESYELLRYAGCARMGHTGGNDTATSGLRPDPDHASGLTGYVPGEGATFFALSGLNREGSQAVIDDMEVIPGHTDSNVPIERMGIMLERNGLGREDIDLLVTGRNGDARYTAGFTEVEDVFPVAEVADYKHLVGEYDTVSAFGIYLAANVLYKQEVPDAARLRKGRGRRMDHALVYNASKGRDHVFVLMSGIESHSAAP
jgi:hypothetical protein